MDFIDVDRPATRLIDLMCAEHQAQCHTRWVHDENVQALLDDCGDCGARARRALGGAGKGKFRSLIPMDHVPSTRDIAETVSVFHEAGHAVVGLAQGMPLAEVVTLDETAEAAATSDLGGWVRWHDYKVSPLTFLSMCWAGQQASLRLLRETPGWDTEEYRLGCRYLSRNDAGQAVTEARPRHLHPETGIAAAGQILDRYWHVVRDLAEWLGDEGRLEGEVVARQYAGALGLGQA